MIQSLYIYKTVILNEPDFSLMASEESAWCKKSITTEPQKHGGELGNRKTAERWNQLSVGSIQLSALS